MFSHLVIYVVDIRKWATWNGSMDDIRIHNWISSSKQKKLIYKMFQVVFPKYFPYIPLNNILGFWL